VLHRSDYRWQMEYDPAPIIALVESGAPQVVDAQSFDYDDVRAWRLADIDPLPAFKEQSWSQLEARQLDVTASIAGGATKLALDGDAATFWDTGGPQRGDEWIRIRLDRERDLVALRMDMPPGDLGPYPRHLRIESESDDGSRAEVFSGAVLAHLMQTLIHDPRRPSITITLPPNRTRTLLLNQLSQTRHAHWSVADFTIWERTPASR
jgi:hypothetical protein